MKYFVIFLVLFLFNIQFCQAQDTTVLLSQSMIDKNSEEILLSDMDGWFFKQGNDDAWAQKGIDITGWKKFKPTQLSVKLADKNDKVEGWFRIKVKLDSSFINIPHDIMISQWAVSDIYIDGNLLASFGNAGRKGAPFREFSSLSRLPFPVILFPGIEYTIAIHLIEYVAPLPPRKLKSEYMGLDQLIILTGPTYDKIYLKAIKTNSIYSTIWISICAILSLLFWFLSLQNPSEKYLRLIAICSSSLTFYIFCNISSKSNASLSFLSFTVFSYIRSYFIVLAAISIILILTEIFKRKVNNTLKYFFVFFCICWIFNDFAQFMILYGFLLFALMSICMYYIVSSWASLQGAQWAIAIGLILLIVSAIIYYMVNFYIGRNSTLYYLSSTGISIFFPLSLLVYVAMRFKEISKEVEKNVQQVLHLSEEKKEHALNQQKILQEEVIRQTAEIRTTLENLKVTQHQLIQSEKMASLGELTAGIAHEIQNPLNFVNNFSEVNAELIDELNDELATGNTQLAKEIAGNIKDNEEKIIFHGKRADAIVKGMLLHSRTSSGIKEPTNINALVDEYLRLAYHGLRAKDKSFNVTMKTDFDPNIGLINIVPQDIGRVILNLITNAFYAVSSSPAPKSPEGEDPSAPKSPKGDFLYVPTVTVITKRKPPSGGLGAGVEIRVEDNGPGIPQNILDKIFQPFFTTKPTGQGTGLGLSLSYDIVKAHGGELKVETKEGEGTTFIVILPA
jgi:two-component system, NtrC family, sensor kinase